MKFAQKYKQSHSAKEIASAKRDGQMAGEWWKIEINFKHLCA